MNGIARRAALWTLLAACTAARAAAGGPEASRASAGAHAGPGALASVPAAVVPSAIVPGAPAELPATAALSDPSGVVSGGAHGAASIQGAEKASETASGELAAAAEAAARGAAPEAGVEDAKAASDAVFDKSAAAQDGAGAVAAKPSLLKRWLGLGRAEARPKTRFDRDEFGGPPKLELGAKGALAHGVRWGLTLTGLSTLLQLAMAPVLAALQWPLNVPAGLLSVIGRVELLNSVGPKLISAAMAAAPAKFLFLAVPLATISEEIVYRGFTLGLWFLVFAATAKLARSGAAGLARLPEILGGGDGSGPIRSLVSVLTRGRVQNASLVGGLARFLNWIGNPRWVFPTAAAMSAFAFAASHFAAWGIHPALIVVHAALGLALAHIVYASRGWGLVTGAIAHYTYNLLTLGAVWAAVAAPGLGSVYGLLVSVGSLAALYWHWRSYRKERGEAVAQAKASLSGAAAALVAVAMMGASLFGAGGLDKQLSTAASRQTTATAPIAWPMKPAQAAPSAPNQTQPPATPPEEDKGKKPDEAKPKGEPHDELDADEKAALQEFMKFFGVVPPKDPAALSGLAKLTAQAKPSVVEVRTPHGLGSGWIVSKDGLLVTNNHVIEPARNGAVLIVFPDGSKVKAKVVAKNKGKDIALVQLPPREGGWRALEVGNSDEVSEGDEVLAMGHPRGLEFTVTRGIVSGLGGDHRRNLYVRHLQTDASINPGNSGGPLINLKGQVVGMNTQILTGGSGSNGSIGLGFAITANDIQLALDQFKAIGNIDSGWLGVVVNQKDPNSPEAGIMLEAVRPGSPAAKAGLQSGDVLLGVDGRPFASGEQAIMQLAATLAHSAPGAKLVFAVGREGDVSFVTLEAGAEKFAKSEDD